MAEAQDWNRGARRARLRCSVLAALWLAGLVAPAFTPWTREVYAAYAVLWLFAPPRPALRPR